MTINTYKPNDTARIEAILFTERNLIACVDWAQENLTEIRDVVSDWSVKTLEGWVGMSYDSYLCKGTSGGFYPCDPDEFEKRWVQVD